MEEENTNAAREEAVQEEVNSTLAGYSFPNAGRRYKAAVIDGLFTAILFFITGMAFVNFPEAPTAVKVIAFFAVFTIYEPLMVTRGGTLGHRILGIRVKAATRPTQNIPIGHAILRTLLKYNLGIINYIGMVNNELKQGFHDMAAGTIVIYTNPE